jgi:hypothetical protein
MREECAEQSNGPLRRAVIVWTACGVCAPRRQEISCRKNSFFEVTMPISEDGFISRVSIRHSISPDAVRIILRALRSGGGRMAQFSHPDFGGMSQWSPGMTMVGDMFNSGMKSKLEAVCTELATYVAETPAIDQGRDREGGAVSYRSTKQSSDW